MEGGLFANMGLDASYLIILLFLIQVLLFVLLMNVNMKYNRLKTSYASFMKGKDGKTLEESVLDRFEDIESLMEMAKKNKQDIKDITRKIEGDYQKLGIVKYDAFHEMGGNLSFALTMLDGNNNGWIINAMHSRDGCYTYIKEIVKGESYIELAEEEAESLDRAIYQEAYGLDIKDLV
ncbi:DUF4446 family protein [Hespellia stercorisuis]|uniref:DUF4446 domain-containing protein n=1 Tax=Hespellia stercorisuis DSM 15480 TaxID=1121950 RepID=A0A1M6R830_9FIRM|nr:DUF4446 family protein [Hespellia stercorisuis]SHK28576.1 Protein of unknown function [Hespellia stercorisuis DSM 15480]